MPPNGLTGHYRLVNNARRNTEKHISSPACVVTPGVSLTVALLLMPQIDASKKLLPYFDESPIRCPQSPNIGQHAESTGMKLSSSCHGDRGFVILRAYHVASVAAHQLRRRLPSACGFIPPERYAIRILLRSLTSRLELRRCTLIFGDCRVIFAIC